MTSDQAARQIIEFYANEYDEAARLSGTADGVLEMARTRELLGRHLPPPPAAVLDVGGGPGAHARWLVEAGYRVHLVDPVERHLTQASTTGCTVEKGDARALTADEGSYDVVLLLGPLYHLQDPDGRRQALAEAVRVVCPEGVIAAAAINRYSPVLDASASTRLAHPPVQAAVETILTTGRHDGRLGFTASYFHTAAELETEIRSAGLTAVTVYGIEGPAWALLKAVEDNSQTSPADSPLFTAVLAAARLAEPYPDLLSASSHFLAVGRRPSWSPGGSAVRSR